MNFHRYRSAIALLSFCWIAPLCHSATLNTWTGGGSPNNEWQVSGNWSEGVAPDDGNTNTYDVLFDNPAGVPTAIIDTTQGGPDVDVNTLTFNQAGWSITGSDPVHFFSPDGTTHITSNGVGVNYLPGLKGGGGAGVGKIETAAGNTLVLTGNTLFGGLKYGDGTLVIDQGTTFTTPITAGFGLTVVEGTVLINGNFTDNVFGYKTRVQSGGTLGGTGQADQTNRVQYRIESGGTFNPGGDGTFGATIGTFTLTNSRGSLDRDSDFYLETGSTFHADIDDLGNSDLFDLVKGAVNPDADIRLFVEPGATLDLWGTAAYGTEYELIRLTGTDTIYDGSAFDTVRLNGNVLTENVDYTAVYTSKADADAGVGGVKLTLINPIPEPDSVLLLLAGLCLLALRRRRGGRN